MWMAMKRKTETKKFIISGMVVVLGLLVGITWQQIPHYPLLAFLPLLFVVLWASAMILFERRAPRCGISMLSIAFLALALGQDKWTLAGGLIGIIFALYAVWNIEWHYRAASAFSFRLIAGRGLKTFFTALALLFSFSYYGASAEKPLDTASILPRDVFNIALRATEGTIQKQFPGFHREATVDDTLALIIQQQLSQSSNSDSDRMPIPSLETIKKELPGQRKEIITNLNRGLKLSINPNISGDENVGMVLYELSISRAEPYLKPYSALISSVVAVALFFALKTVSIAYYYVTLLLLPAVFWLLQTSGIIEKKVVSAEKEIFEFITIH